MTATTQADGAAVSSIANSLLKAAGGFWFAVAAGGQVAFVYFILGFYAGPTISGDFEAWDRNHFLTRGYVAGDVAGNLAFAAHVLLAALIILGGIVQLIPQIRTRALVFHRWNGRVYIAAAFAISLAGLYMSWVRSRPNHAGEFATSLDAVLIMAFAGLALAAARAGDVRAHRRWAMRLFLAVNGVWFLRVGLLLWIILNGGKAVGVGADLGGPAGIALSYGCFLVPLAVLELYFLAQERARPAGKLAMAATLTLLTVGMGAGIVGAYAFFWRPLLSL